MKRLQILAAILAIGTMCITGCNMGGATTSDRAQPQTRNLVVQEDSGKENPAPTPDKDCEKDGNCNRDKMPHAKPNFKFKAPNGKHRGNGKDKFRRHHKRPAPKPEEPETPAEKENTNN